MYYRSVSIAMVVLVGAQMLPLAAADPDILQIGMSDSQMQELSFKLRPFVVPEFSKMVSGFTGFKNKVVPRLDPMAAAEQLKTGTLHLCVLQGVEFAWLQAKNPDLRSLLVANYDPPVRRALLVGRTDDPFEGFADLKGKNVRVLQSLLHCRLFANKGAKEKSEDYFGKIAQKKLGAEDTLDDLLAGNVQAAIVDTTLLDNYKNINPGRFKRLKILAQSEPFPGSVIVYRSEALSDKMLTKLRTGLLEGGKTEPIKELMATIHIKSFQTVPDDYQKNLTSILKDYPAPTAQDKATK